MLLTKKRTTEHLFKLHRRLMIRVDYINDVIYPDLPTFKRLEKTAWSRKMRDAVWAMARRQNVRGNQ